MSVWAWVLLYNGAAFFVQIFFPRRFANGLSGKITKKWLKEQWSRHFLRYFGWLGVFILTFSPSLTKTTPVWAVFWAVAVLYIVDDYIFGNDDTWKRLWEGVRNKIKWQMDLPPEPIRQEVA